MLYADQKILDIELKTLLVLNVNKPSTASNAYSGFLIQKSDSTKWLVIKFKELTKLLYRTFILKKLLLIYSQPYTVSLIFKNKPRKRLLPNPIITVL